ncbi:MAG: hypothetical protein HY319_11155 [Armatimonadetes bacterium]|nr:hypothetical protein [Armatimonadota bacterium]
MQELEAVANFVNNTRKSSAGHLWLLALPGLFMMSRATDAGWVIFSLGLLMLPVLRQNYDDYLTFTALSRDRVLELMAVSRLSPAQIAGGLILAGFRPILPLLAVALALAGLVEWQGVTGAVAMAVIWAAALGLYSLYVPALLAAAVVSDASAVVWILLVGWGPVVASPLRWCAATGIGALLLTMAALAAGAMVNAAIAARGLRILGF